MKDVTKCFVINPNDYIGVNWHNLGFEVSDQDQAEVLFVGVDTINDSYLNNFPLLKLIATRTTNRDNIVTSRFPVVFLEKDEVSDITSTAEFTIMLMLMLLKRVKSCLGCNNRLSGYDLHGKTICIVGHGRIGKRVDALSSAFGMGILLCTKNTSTSDMKYMFGESDVISLHLPANQKFVNFIDDDKIEWMKKSAVVINSARPYMVDKISLLKALKVGRISGAALDYLGFETDEPDEDLMHYAKKCDNLIVTPHLGGNSRDAIQIVAERLVRKVRNMIWTR